MATRKFFDTRFIATERRRASILACLLFWSILSYLFVSRFVLMATEVDGDSMAPTMHSGERYIINRWVYRLAEPVRGDIVAIRIPGYDDLSVKRIVAFPWERIQLKDSRVFINEWELAEPYLPGGVATSPGMLLGHKYLVEPDCYFVLGDNRRESMDSRYFGAVRREWIIGRLVFPRDVVHASL